MSSDTIQFTSLGGVGEVGASAHLLEIDGITILLDCGMHPKKEGAAALPDFSLLRKAPDAIIVSHAHIDHCGSLPHLMALFPGVSAYCTKPTLRIMDRMLHNSVSVMGKIRVEQGIEEYPLYSHEDADAAMRRTYGIDMNSPFQVYPQVPIDITFSHAGHVLGSASVRIDTPNHSVFYTGDICTVDQELMQAYHPPRDPEAIQTLIIESTYGATERGEDFDYNKEIEELGRSITEVVDRGGTALIPSFALGRAQEILNIIARLQYEGSIPLVPVYASGLGRAVYEIYDRFWDHLKPDAELSPLSEFLHVGDVWDPKVVRELTQTPCIIVATSGMMIENTPSAMIAQELVREKRHGIFFVGYCDPDTVGYKLRVAEVGDELVFERGAKPTKVALEDIKAFHFSAHAPREALQAVIDNIPSKNLVFVHGDPPALEWMYYNSGNGRKKFVPAIGETIPLEA